MSRFCEFTKDQIVSNEELMEMFKCSNSGGMRRSKETNSLALIAKHDIKLYTNKWKNDIFHYTGMGQVGDQSLDYKQNKILAKSDNIENLEIHLFESFYPNEYIYKGRVFLAEKPYQEKQLDINCNKRSVWIFPLRLI